MNDVIAVFIFAYLSGLLLLVVAALFYFLRYDTVVIVPENIAAQLGKQWEFDKCEHKSKFVGHLNNRYIEKCEDCGKLLKEEYAKALSKHV